MTANVTALKAKLRKITVHFLYHDALRELSIDAKGHRYETEPELLIVETMTGGTVEWPLDCVVQVFDEPA